MNFHFLSINNNFFKTLYADFDNCADCELISLDEKLQCPPIIRIFSSWRLPFPWIRGKVVGFFYWNRIFSQLIKTKDSKSNCFIIYGRILDIYGPSIFCYLEKFAPKSIKICYLGDVVSSFRFKLESIKNKFDFIYSLDRKDSKKHNIGFIQEPYSFRQLPKDKEIYDVLFIGAAKNRLDKIITIYEKLVGLGYDCLFYIVGVPDNKKKYESDIHYNQYLDYKTVLKFISQSRCLLEVLQDDADTTTTRYSEALLYGKYLLTDSAYLKKQKELPQNIITIDYVNWSNLVKIKENIEFDNSVAICDLSVQTMIYSISRDIANIFVNKQENKNK